MLASADSLHIVYAVALVFGVGIALQWIAARLRLPALLLLLVTGLSLGPFSGALDPDQLLGPLLAPLVSISVAIVLFEGGLSLRLHEARLAGKALRRLLISGLVVGSILTTLFAVAIADLSLATAGVLGAILVVTGPTVILPMLRREKIAPRPASLLKWEGIVNDPLGALLAVVVFRVALLEADDSAGVVGLLVGIVLTALAAGAIGAGFAWLLGLGLRRHLFAETLKSPAMLAGVLVAYAIGETLGTENGLVAVTVMGMVLGNLDEVRLEDIRHFKEQISILLVSALFIVLSARIAPDTLRALFGAPLLVVLAVVFVVRPIVALVAFAGTDIPRNERLLISWIAPRGVVAAAVAAASEPRLLEVGYEDARLLVPTVFGVILVTVVLHGLSLGPFARALGLSAKRGSGILIVGATLWAVALARSLKKAGAFVVLIDAQYYRVSRARRSDIEARYGNVLDEETTVELPFDRVCWLLAATDDDAYNSLVCTAFMRDLGPDKVLQVTPATEQDHALLGRRPWGERGTFNSITRAFFKDDEVRVTTLSETFTWTKLREANPNALFLFAVVDSRILTLQGDADPPAGAKILYLRDVSPKASASGDAAAVPADEARALAD